MGSDEVQALQIEQLTEAVAELKQANREQAAFNIAVVTFMAKVTTWGKVGLLLWALGQGVLLIILAKLVE